MQGNVIVNLSCSLKYFLITPETRNNTSVGAISRLLYTEVIKRSTTITTSCYKSIFYMWINFGIQKSPSPSYIRIHVILKHVIKNLMCIYHIPLETAILWDKVHGTKVLLVKPRRKWSIKPTESIPKGHLHGAPPRCRVYIYDALDRVAKGTA